MPLAEAAQGIRRVVPWVPVSAKFPFAFALVSAYPLTGDGVQEQSVLPTKEGITDKELKDAAKQVEAGQADANLGGNVYKVRVARSGEGKSGGYRVIVLFKTKDKTFYVHGFAKSDRGNIGPKELRNLKRLADSIFALTDTQIVCALQKGEMKEI